MRWVMLRSVCACAVVLAAYALAAPAADDKKGDKDEGFRPLYNGKDFTGWKFRLRDADADPKKTFSVADEGVILVMGKPDGFFYTEKRHKGYVLRFDWQYKRTATAVDDRLFKGNSGCLVHIQDPKKEVREGNFWPKCVEVQGANRDHGRLLFLGVKGKGKFDQEAKDKAARKIGEWNTTEVTCKADGSVAGKLNGTEVSTGKSDLTEGHIGFQSEGSEIHFRNIKIKDLK
jgi:hypothetical protein